jgi:hypothetical protein
VLSESLAHELTDAEKADIAEREGHVDGDITDAKKAHEAGDDIVAIPLLRDALATTEKLLAFMSSIDVRTNVSLDALVPQKAADDSQKTQPVETDKNIKVVEPSPAGVKTVSQ